MSLSVTAPTSPELLEIHLMASRACYYFRRGLKYTEFIPFLPSSGFLVWGKLVEKHNKTQRDTVTITRLFLKT